MKRLLRFFFAFPFFIAVLFNAQVGFAGDVIGEANTQGERHSYNQERLKIRKELAEGDFDRARYVSYMKTTSVNDFLESSEGKGLLLSMEDTLYQLMEANERETLEDFFLKVKNLDQKKYLQIVEAAICVSGSNEFGYLGYLDGDFQLSEKRDADGVVDDIVAVARKEVEKETRYKKMDSHSDTSPGQGNKKCGNSMTGGLLGGGWAKAPLALFTLACALVPSHGGATTAATTVKAGSTFLTKLKTAAATKAATTAATTTKAATSATVVTTALDWCSWMAYGAASGVAYGFDCCVGAPVAYALESAGWPALAAYSNPIAATIVGTGGLAYGIYKCCQKPKKQVAPSKKKK